jgi:hypothetical protein
VTRVFSPEIRVNEDSLITCCESILPGKFLQKNEIVAPVRPDKKFIFTDKDFLLTKSCEMDKFVETELVFSNVFVHSAAGRWRVGEVRIIIDKLKGEQVKAYILTDP